MPFGLHNAQVNTGPVPEVNMEEYLRRMAWVRWHLRRSRNTRKNGGYYWPDLDWAAHIRRQAQFLRAPGN
jgi:hypothetical protein